MPRQHRARSPFGRAHLLSLTGASVLFVARLAQTQGNVFCYLSSPKFRYLGDVGDLLKWAAGEFGYEDRSHDIIYDRLGKKAMRAYAAKSGHSFVYLDVGIGGESEGRVTLELFDNKAPVTCENFKQLLKGVSNVESGESWGYKGTPFHRVRKGGWIQGGDVVDGSGANGKSAAPDGAPLNDETFTVCFDKPGILAMANTGPNTSASQFFLTMRALPWMDTTKVAFGRVIDGFRTLRIVERIETQNERPVVDVTIDQCGLLEY